MGVAWGGLESRARPRPPAGNPEADRRKELEALASTDAARQASLRAEAHITAPAPDPLEAIRQEVVNGLKALVRRTRETVRLAR